MSSIDIIKLTTLFVLNGCRVEASDSSMQTGLIWSTAEIIISHFESVRWKKQIIVNLMSLRRVCRGFHFRTTLEACFINDFQVIEERSRAKH